MSNNKDPWDIIGWGVIIAFVLRALPVVLLWVFCFWFLGYYDWLGEFVVKALGILARLIVLGIVLMIIGHLSKGKRP